MTTQYNETTDLLTLTYQAWPCSDDEAVDAVPAAMAGVALDLNRRDAVVVEEWETIHGAVGAEEYQDL